MKIFYKALTDYLRYGIIVLAEKGKLVPNGVFNGNIFRGPEWQRKMADAFRMVTRGRLVVFIYYETAYSCIWGICGKAVRPIWERQAAHAMI